jgi:hypothetical protein
MVCLMMSSSEETPDKAGKQRAFARHYLEKLINIEVPVPALDDAATDSLLLRGTVRTSRTMRTHRIGWELPRGL